VTPVAEAVQRLFGVSHITLDRRRCVSNTSRLLLVPPILGAVRTDDFTVLHSFSGLNEASRFKLRSGKAEYHSAAKRFDTTTVHLYIDVTDPDSGKVISRVIETGSPTIGTGKA